MSYLGMCWWCGKRATFAYLTDDAPPITVCNPDCFGLVDLSLTNRAVAALQPASGREVADLLDAYDWVHREAGG